MVAEAPLEQTEHGLFAAGAGWFVLNLREVRWFDRGLGGEAGLGGEGAGDGHCVAFRFGARENHTTRAPDGRLQGRDDSGAYTVDEAAVRHGAGVEEETTDAGEAYARIAGNADPKPVQYREGWLPPGD